MAIKIGSNFTFQGKQPNFERDRFATKAAMKAFPETSIDDGHLSYCAEDGNTYQFKSSNSVDDVTGKWRVFKANVDLSDYATKVDLDNKVDIAGKSVYSVSSVKVATIDVPNRPYTIRTISIDIRCRQANITTVVIGVSTNEKNEPIATGTKTIIGPASNTEKVYYYIDRSNAPTYKVIVYYKNDNYDTVSCRVTGVNVKDVVYSLNMEAIANIPEDAVEIKNFGYGNKNFFYATPKDAAGDPKFRAIDITDLPDLSSKYATKEKAFTKDTASTEPGQVVAGPATTQGNLYLRKLIADDIPDLKSKYQKLDSNGYQEKAKVAGLIVKHGNTGDTGSGYLIAEIDQAVGGQMGPDWYYATDGTLQDIKTKIPKVVLDDAVSTTSDNGVKNSAITEYVNSNIADLHSSLESTQTDFVDLRNKVNAMPKTVFITQAAYDALTTKDTNTIYYING